MKLQNINAKPHPSGNRIDLTWENLEPDLYPGVRVVRREITYPVTYNDGYLVAQSNAFLFNADAGVTTDLDNQTIPPDIYQLFVGVDILLSNNASVSIITPSQKWIITDEEQKYILKHEGAAISAYKQGKVSLTDNNLKSETVYYYGFFPFRETPLEYVVDYSNRASSMATGCYDMAGQMYELLPRIYHRYDTVLSNEVAETDKIKGELRRFLDISGGQLDQLYSFAKALLQIHRIDKIDGALLPLLGQWIGWKTDYRLEIDKQRNEISAATYLYQTIGLIPNVEATVKRISGWESRTKEFVHNVFLTNNPERLNIWAKEKIDIDEWSEPTEPLSLDYAFEGRSACVYEDTKTWLFYHTIKKRFWNKDKTFREVSNIWYKTCENGQWSPSQPLIDHTGIDKHPSAAVHGTTPIVFWDRYDETAETWHIEYLSYRDDAWSQDDRYDDPPSGDNEAQRKKPLAITDDNKGLWLFWLEKAGQFWQMKYNRHNGTSWQSPVAFPIKEAMEDPFVLFYGPKKRIYIFWTRRNSDGKKSVVYTYKKTIDMNLSDWNVSVKTVPREPNTDYNDREPAALVRNTTIEVFWSSDREGNYSIWESTLTPQTDTWEEALQVTFTPYSQRDPLPLDINGSTTITYRSNESVSYESEIYKATETVDFRYAGSVSVDTNNLDKNGLRGQFEDFQTYTYDTGKKDYDWYARDTVGMYLTAGTGDPNLINLNRGIIKQLLREIMPIQVRAAFIIDTVYKENVFPEGFPMDQFRDAMTCLMADICSGAKDAHTDTIPEWVWLRACDCINALYFDHRTVDCESIPVETNYRTWHIGLKEEE